LVYAFGLRVAAVVACGRTTVRGPNPFPGGGWVPGRIRPQGWAEGAPFSFRGRRLTAGLGPPVLG